MYAFIKKGHDLSNHQTCHSVWNAHRQTEACVEKQLLISHNLITKVWWYRPSCLLSDCKLTEKKEKMHNFLSLQCFMPCVPGGLHNILHTFIHSTSNEFRLKITLISQNFISWTHYRSIQQQCDICGSGSDQQENLAINASGLSHKPAVKKVLSWTCPRVPWAA